MISLSKPLINLHETGCCIRSACIQCLVQHNSPGSPYCSSCVVSVHVVLCDCRCLTQACYTMHSTSYEVCYNTVLIALSPGPEFVACSTIAEESLVKSSCMVMYLDMWRSGMFILYSCGVAFWTRLSLYDVDHSVILWSMVAFDGSLTNLHFLRDCATPPHVHPMSTAPMLLHVMSFTRPPPVSTASSNCWGIRVYFWS